MEKLVALFETSVPLTSAAPSEARISTPSVTLDVHALVGGSRLVASEAFQGADGLSLRRHARETLVVELLILPFAPRLADGTVDAGVVLVWRLLALADAPPVDLRAAREPDALRLETSPRSPICACARTWRGRNTRVSLGAPESEMMATLEGYGWFPERLAAEIEDDPSPEKALSFGPRGDGYVDGKYQNTLGVALPPLLAGERIQAHLTVAWAEGPIERRDYGTIEAVGLIDPSSAMAERGVS